MRALPVLKGSHVKVERPILKDREYKAIEPLLDTAMSILISVFKELDAQGYVTFVRKKAYKSSREKLIRKGLTDYLSLTDLVKGTVLLNDLDSIILVVAYLKGQLDTAKIEVKVGDVMNPYKGVVHLDVVVEGVVCEIQVTTETNWAIKKESNPFYKNGCPTETASLWEYADTFTNAQLECLVNA
jgi:hypothetical protein